MYWIGCILGAVYLLCMIAMSFYGLNSMAIGMIYLFTKMRLRKERAVPDPKEWPCVTIQLPIFNEKYVVERLLWAVTKLDYPADRVQIQLLDDSTNDTTLLSTRLVDGYRTKGINVEYIHRMERTGFKAGALKKGLETATGELIAIFDADFIPPPNWLLKTVPPFQDSKLGCVQTRYGYTNRDYNLLTRAQALALDAHFLVEQIARSRNNLFTNFNGTAGIWRRSCIKDAGNWETDSLTEDLDLSFRAQMRGWRIGYLPDVVVPSELPIQIEAFKKQQFRWAQGSTQVARKILRRLLRISEIPLYKRIMAFLHLTGHMVHLLMVVMFLLTLPVGILAPRVFTLLPVSIVAVFGPLIYALAASLETPSRSERVLILPFLVIIGIATSLNTAIAVIQAIVGKCGTFIRTPKLNLNNKPRLSQRMDATQLQPISSIVWGEIGLGIYSVLTITILQPHLGWGLVSWMGMYSLSYFWIASLNLFQSWQANHPTLNAQFDQQG